MLPRMPVLLVTVAIAVTMVSGDVCGDVCGDNTMCDTSTEMCVSTCPTESACCTPIDGLCPDNSISIDCVCDFDPFCCNQQWDAQCVDEAQTRCGLQCGPGTIDCSQLDVEGRTFFTAPLNVHCDVVLPPTVSDAVRASFCKAGAQGYVNLVHGNLANKENDHSWLAEVVFHGDCVPQSTSCEIDGTSYNTTLIGMHVHEGNATTNGPVYIAFCGSGDPLGTLEEGGSEVKACEQVSPAFQEGAICTTEDGPCTQRPDPAKNYYFNVHTPWSLAVTKGNGAFRGQMKAADKNFCRN